MMDNRLNTATSSKRDKFTRQDTAAAINYISETLSPNRSNIKNAPRFDDLIVSLANAHENRRARQVTEWERMLRHNAQRTM